MIRHSTSPASRARDGILRPSGAMKNSGKIVTTLIRRRVAADSSPLHPVASVIEQARRRIDPNHALLAIDVRDDPFVWNEHRTRLPFNIERESLRQIVGLDDGTHRLA